MLRFPAQDTLQFLGAGDQNGRVPRAPRPELARDFTPGDPFGGFDHFEDGIATTLAYIERLTGNAVDFLESAHVGIGDVENVHIIANGSAVRRWIVCAKNIDMR